MTQGIMELRLKPGAVEGEVEEMAASQTKHLHWSEHDPFQSPR